MSCTTVQEGSTVEVKATLIDKCCKRAADLTGALSVQIRLRAPDGTVSTEAAEFLGDLRSGMVLYVVNSGVLEKGTWSVQFYVYFPNSRVLASSIGRISVLENL